MDRFRNRHKGWRPLRTGLGGFGVVGRSQGTVSLSCAEVIDSFQVLEFGCGLGLVVGRIVM